MGKDKKKKAKRNEEGKDARIERLEGKLEANKVEMGELAAQLAESEEAVRVLKKELEESQAKVVDLIAKQPGVATTAEETAPPACILTGVDGENPNDCTTHNHEKGADNVG